MGRSGDKQRREVIGMSTAQGIHVISHPKSPQSHSFVWLKCANNCNFLRNVKSKFNESQTMSWILKQMFLLANFSFFLLQNENRRCQEGVKASYSYGEISFSIPDALKLRTNWLVWWQLLFKGRLLSRTKVPGSSRGRCFEQPGLPDDGLPSLQAPIFHLIVFTLHSKPLSYPEMLTMLLSADMQPSLSLFQFQCPLGCESQADPSTPAGSHGLWVSSPQGVYSSSRSPAYSAPFLVLEEHPLGFCGQMHSWHTWPHC